MLLWLGLGRLGVTQELGSAHNTESPDISSSVSFDSEF